MAVDMFIKIGVIKGESKDDTHKDEIDVLAWSWGESNSGTTHQGGGGGSGKVNVQDLSFTKWVDLSTASLMQACTTGQHVDTATLTVRKAGGGVPLEYIIINMQEVMVTSLSTGGSGGEDRLTENVTLNFAKFKYKYVPQGADGAAGTPATFGWDIEANKVIPAS
jgi:type VI secretion system secreted protein Hcp